MVIGTDIWKIHAFAYKASLFSKSLQWKIGDGLYVDFCYTGEEEILAYYTDLFPENDIEYLRDGTRLLRTHRDL